MRTETETARWSAPSTAVIQGVADALGVDPTDLPVPLHDYVDPDALDALFSPTHGGEPRGKGYVQFTMLECTVVVYAHGTVEVEPPLDDASARTSG